VKECRELWLSEPKLPRVGVKTGLLPRFRFLTNELKIPLTKLRRIVQKHPRILLYSLENNLIPKLVVYLILTLSMEPSQVQRLLLSYPAFLDYNLENHILPISRYLVQELGYCPAELRSILLKFPRLMTYSLANIKHTAGFLRYEVGLTGVQVKRVLFQAPQVIGFREELVKEKMDFLQAAFGLTEEQVQKVVVGMPTVLVLSIADNLKPKQDYLMEAFENDLQAVGKAVLRLPTLLGYSLDKRIRPRLQAIRQTGLDPSRITVGIPMKQENFEGWLKRRAEKHQVEEQRHKEVIARSSAAVPMLKDLSPARAEEPKEPERIVNWTRERRLPSQRSKK
jgi:mTERF domain-containing protein